MKISTLFGGVALLISSVAQVQAQTYCQPSKTNPANFAHAASQSFYSLVVTSGGKTLLSYTDGPCKNAYNWLQDEQSFKTAPGEKFLLDVRSGIWTWDIQIGFDWDGDGNFEDIQRAFSTPGTAITEATSSWNPIYASTYADTNWRRAQQSSLGHRGVVQHQFTVNVPADAKAGKSRMRILCDGDGYAGGHAPALDMCNSVGYAGSMHDFGVEVTVVNAIDHVKTSDTATQTDEVYTLSGVRLNTPVKDLPKGIYIVNGKKIVNP